MGQDRVYTLHQCWAKSTHVTMYGGHFCTVDIAPLHPSATNTSSSHLHTPTTAPLTSTPPPQPLSPPHTHHSSSHLHTPTTAPSHLHTPTTAPLTSIPPPQPLSPPHSHYSPSHLKALEESVQLLWGEVPRQLGQQVVNVLDDGLVLALLTGPDSCPGPQWTGPSL